MRTSLDTRIKFSDIDSCSEVRFGSLIDIMQDCMNMQSEATGTGVAYQQQTKRAWILSAWQLNFHDSLRYGDSVTAETWPYMFKGACGRRNAVIRKVGEKDPVVLADSIWALFDVEKGCLCRLTEKDRLAYACEEPLVMDHQKGKIVRLQQYREYPAFTVRHYQLDFNRHMNNSWYVKLAEEFLENREGIRSLRVEYKKQALLGDTVIPYVGDDESGRRVVELRNPAQEVFAVIEFSR